MLGNKVHTEHGLSVHFTLSRQISRRSPASLIALNASRALFVYLSRFPLQWTLPASLSPHIEPHLRCRTVWRETFLARVDLWDLDLARPRISRLHRRHGEPTLLSETAVIRTVTFTISDLNTQPFAHEPLDLATDSIRVFDIGRRTRKINLRLRQINLDESS